MENDLTNFLIYYVLRKRHSGLVRELKVKTPIEAVREWYEIKPELFKETPDVFRAKLD